MQAVVPLIFQREWWIELLEQEQEQECCPDYITTTNLYNQKVAAAGDDELAEPALPFLFKSVMF